MSTREEFLGRVQKALGRHPGQEPPIKRLEQLFPPLQGVMPPITSDQIIDKFEDELQRVGGFTHRAGTAAQLDEILKEVLRNHQAESVVCTRHPVLEAAGIPEKLTAWGIASTIWPDEEDGSNSFKEKAFSADVGISGVDFVLAESGSLILTSRTERAQIASLAPPTHIALYRRGQALAFLEEVLERLPVPTDPRQALPGRSVVFITGASRTADIEQILVRGVHGPKEIHAILVEDSCLA